MANAIIGFVFCFKGHKGFSELRPECTVFTIYYDAFAYFYLCLWKLKFYI